MDLKRIAALHSKAGHLGPGGIECPCCTPFPKRVQKVVDRRAARMILKRWIRKELQEYYREREAA